MMNEVQNRFAEIGFKVELIVDKETGNFTFDIIGRTDSNHEFDYEKKQWEVKKSKEVNESIQELL